MFVTLPTFVIVPLFEYVAVCPLTKLPLVILPVVVFVNAVPSYTLLEFPAFAVMFLLLIVKLSVAVTAL